MAESRILDRYRLIERLAAGGSAEVWRAHDEQLDRPVAVKRLHPHLVPDEAARRRIAAEARSAAGLSHPVIVGVYDVDASVEAPAIVMELVEGESLAARIARDGPLPPRQAAEITADVADALYHAHQQGVIHRDIKPGNVLLSIEGRTRLVDFGIARSLAEAAERLTLTGTVIGTLASMAPEQLAGGAITPRTDLYGLGVVLHEALTGRPPYPASSPLVLAEAQRAGPPPIDGVEPAIAAIAAACLAHDPNDRPLHAGALATALRGWLAGDRSAARSMAPAVAAGPASAEVTQPIRSPTPVPRPTHPGPSRRPPRWILLPLATLPVLLLLVMALTGTGPWERAGDEAVGVTPTDSPTALPTTPAPARQTVEPQTVEPPPPEPPPAAAPDWLAKLVRDVAKDCGEDTATAVEAELAVMTEDAADDYVDDLTDACKEERRENEGGGRGGGNSGSGGDD